MPTCCVSASFYTNTLVECVPLGLERRLNIQVSQESRYRTENYSLDLVNFRRLDYQNQSNFYDPTLAE